MIIHTKRELFWMKYRYRVVPIIFAVIGMALGIIGYKTASFEKISGIIDCSEMFEMIWKCLVFPFAIILISNFTHKPRKAVISIMLTKIAITLIGLVFGINTNISLPLFYVDWGVLFFIAVDAIILYVVCTSKDGRTCVMGAVSVVLMVMLVSDIIIKISGNPEPTYIYRLLSMMMYYYPIWYIVNFTARRQFVMPTPEEWAKIKEKEGEKDD